MAKTAWNPFGVSMIIEAYSTSVTRTSAIAYTVTIQAKWNCGYKKSDGTYVYDGNKTDYGMTASSGGGSKSLNTQGTKANSGSGSFTGTYSISGNGSATKQITVTFKNYNDWHKDSATKSVSFDITVPAWTSYTISYDANGGSGAPNKQTKWKGQNLTLDKTKPTYTGRNFKNWNTVKAGNGTSYAPGATYSTDAGATLYAQWSLNTYTITYDANTGTGGPETQTKTYGTDATITSSTPTKADHTFKGWSTSKTSTTVTYKPGDKYKSNANITLYAVWELSYTKPRITNVRINRCIPITTSTETIDDEGTYFVLNFDWETDKSNPKYEVRWKEDAESWNESTTTGEIELTGTSGLSQKIRKGADIGKNGEISVEKTYNVKLTVTDFDEGGNKAGSTSVYVDIPSLIMALDVYPDSITFLRLDSISAGSVNNRIHYDTNKFTHEENTTYTLSFSARSPNGSSILYSCVDTQYSPKNYSLTSSWQSYTYTYTTTSSGSLTFFLSRASTKADITNIELRESGRTYSLLAANASTSTDYWTIVGSDSTIKLSVETEKMGLGVAIGKTAETPNLFDVSLPSKFRENVVFNVGVAIGKTAETPNLFDVNLPSKFRENVVFSHDKSIIGTDADGIEYHALMPLTSSGNTSLGYGLYNAGKGNTHIYGNAIQFYANNGIHANGNHLYFNNNKCIYGTKPNGDEYEAINLQNASGNLVLGYDNYDNKNGQTNIYGYDINFGVSNIADPGTYRPYRRKGDDISITLDTSGYVTGSSKQVVFWVPMSVPVIGSPSITVTTNNGFVLRQNNAYTHGSGWNSTESKYIYAKPTSYAAEIRMFYGIRIPATFSATTNAINNAPVGINWSGTITFS